jgi:hypothetical protein
MRAGRFEFLPHTEHIKLRWENDGGGEDIYDFDVPLGAEDEQAIRLEVTVTDSDREYMLFTGRGSNTPYAWYIDWGDGTPIATYTGYPYSSDSSPYYGTSPRHTYPGAGTYPITITPAQTLSAWALAYGQDSNWKTGQDFQSAANRGKLTKLDALLTPEMCRTQSEIANDALPGYQDIFGWALLCPNLKSAGNTRFSRSWGRLTKCQNLLGVAFSGCKSLEAMPPLLTFPQSIETAAAPWALGGIFENCSHPNFSMNKIFNLPQKISGAVPRAFGWAVFRGCSGAAFAMNDVFQVPQGITSTAADGEFLSGAFHNCSGAGFRVNDIFRFPLMPQTEVDKPSSFANTFNGVKSPQPPPVWQKASSTGTLRHPPQRRHSEARLAS